MKVAPFWRKALLTTHIVTAVGWLGADVVLLALGIAGLAGADPGVVYPAAGLIVTALFAPLAVLVWVVGVLDALVSPWRLFRYRWVMVKLIVTTVMLGLVLFLLLPNLRALGELGAATTGRDRLDLVIPPAVSTSLLVAMTVLSTYKPWGRISRPAGNRASRAAGSPTPGARSGPAGTRTETAVRAPTG
ncbi:hypothetical protein AB0J86_14875 [Micromonospora sp. NPDC049559]|uniref:hypothetical protein n=1 Tax=Micromonospora sp. NPDC049559 TaxID=3155923 RepID=UPI0034413CF0